jgi:hypothetical protein
MMCNPDPDRRRRSPSRGTVVPGLAAKDSTGTGTFG